LCVARLLFFFAEIADAAFDPESYRQIMGVLARRLQERVSREGVCEL